MNGSSRLIVSSVLQCVLSDDGAKRHPSGVGAFRVYLFQPLTFSLSVSLNFSMYVVNSL